MKRPLSRRTLLRGAGGIALALPTLHAMAPARAQPQTAAQRFIGWFTPNGTVHAAWRPSGTEAVPVLGAIMAPLERHKSKLLLLTDINDKAPPMSATNGHGGGMGSVLTGRPLGPGTLASGQEPKGAYPTSASVDQEIAARIGAGTRFRSLELGVNPYGAAALWQTANYKPSQPLLPEGDPAVVFQRLFGGTPEAPTTMSRVWIERQSILDAVKDDFADLRLRVGSEDRLKLDRHLDTVREIEKRLQPSDATSMVCSKRPSAPGALDPKKSENVPSVGKLQMDMLVVALACDLTRVATLQWGSATYYKPLPWLNIATDHHTLSHAGDADTGARAKLVTINAWFAAQLAYFLDQLQQHDLLAGSAVLWFNELAKGNVHNHVDKPFLLAGNAGGKWKTGRWLRCGGASANDLHVSLLNAYGVPATTFGHPSICTGPLKNFTG